jgi:signal transduction histidine kinase
VLLGNIDLLQRRAQPNYRLTERDQRALHVLGDQVRRLNQLIVDLLDVSRLENGQLSIERATVDLGALTQRVVEEMQLALDTHQIAYVAIGQALLIKGDELRLEQVLYNLLENAKKYSPAGGTIDVRVARREDLACISVSDNGIGIPERDVPRLFDRFYRAGNADAPGLRGIGIGLFVVKEIVTLHGGRVEVESTEGQGSTFTIFLPLAS